MAAINSTIREVIRIMYRGWAYCRSQNKTVVGKVILFGSYAKSNPHLDSDIDLLVVLDSNKKSKKFAERSENYLRVSRCLRDIERKIPNYHIKTL